MQRFCKEVVTWRMLRHPNVQPLLGVTMSEHRFVTVSEWEKNGNIIEFMENGNPDRMKLVFLLFRLLFALLVIDDSVIVTAQRRYKRTDLYA